jgi:hypothetical protein
MKIKSFDPQQTYIKLSAEGDAIKTVGGEAFWQLVGSRREAFGRMTPRRIIHEMACNRRCWCCVFRPGRLIVHTAFWSVMG